MTTATQGKLFSNTKSGQTDLITYPDLIEQHDWVLHRKELKSPVARVQTRTCADCGARLRTHRTFKGTLSSIIIDPANEDSQYFVIQDPIRSVLKAVDENTYYEKLMKQLTEGKTKPGR